MGIYCVTTYVTHINKYQSQVENAKRERDVKYGMRWQCTTTITPDKQRRCEQWFKEQEITKVQELKD